MLQDVAERLSGSGGHSKTTKIHLEQRHGSCPENDECRAIWLRPLLHLRRLHVPLRPQGMDSGGLCHLIQKKLGRQRQVCVEQVTFEIMSHLFCG